ncbi:hypothetical protein BCR37DRAFT_388136 [Protomyces lactucae-debilis]|uniref:Arrestin-like N-terminal domain-containing protein n=1 Tax=Protomyces lactucae-debilis TaxID=2754530 RepID=A0A1Y2F965_PROLT|nr:uncharacterized protein BCR37DRAFT_388136 [Protomyces lactucae-debilis]ORY80413.1 hypothetical protein BCR37DRAFT_388136 [Protomyces lactucae-debilis]
MISSLRLGDRTNSASSVPNTQQPSSTASGTNSPNAASPATTPMALYHSSASTPQLQRYGAGGSATTSRANSRNRSLERERERLEKQDALRIGLDQCYAYRSLDRVAGKVNYSGHVCERVKIHLTGTSYLYHAKFINGSYRNVEKQWEFLKLTQKIVIASEGVPEARFSFRLPDALLETLCPLKDPFHLLLPPTMGCRRTDGLDDLSPKDPLNAKIEYRIKVELFRDGEIIKTFSTPFSVAPRHFASPNAMNPPPEYDAAVKETVDVTRSLGGTIGQMLLHLPSPPALLSSLEEHQMTTAFTMNLEFHSITSSPPKITGLGIKLQAITRSRMEHALEDGGVEDVKRMTELRLNRLCFSKNHGPAWSPLRPGVWQCAFECPVTLCPKGYVACPEFESCLIERNYRLNLKLELVPAHGLPLSEVRFIIPAWIMADEYYGLPSESGVPIKERKRFSVPSDMHDEVPGSLPNYEDMYLSNVAPTATNPDVIGNLGTHAAPFRFTGREPDYFARGRTRPAPTAPIALGGAGSSHAGTSSSTIPSSHGGRTSTTIARRARAANPRGAGVSQTLEGLAIDDEAEQPTGERDPAWLIKERARDTESRSRRQSAHETEGPNTDAVQ